MTKQIDFTKNKNGDYEASWVSTGAVTVQIERKTLESVIVLGNIPGMSPCVTAMYDNRYNNGIIFGVDLPVGVVVTLRCPAEILSAKMMGDD